MGQLLARRIRVLLQVADRRHDEAGHAERALETLLVDHALLHRVQCAVGRCQAFDVWICLPRTVWVSTEHEVPRHVVDQHRAGAALRAIAAELGAGQPQLVAERHGQRFVRRHVDAPVLAVDAERDQPLDAAGACLAGDNRAGAKQVGRRRAATLPAITPLMKLRLETPAGVSPIVCAS